MAGMMSGPSLRDNRRGGKDFEIDPPNRVGKGAYTMSQLGLRPEIGRAHV